MVGLAVIFSRVGFLAALTGLEPVAAVAGAVGITLAIVGIFGVAVWVGGGC